MKLEIRIGAALSLLLAVATAAAQEPEQPYQPHRDIPPPIQRQARGEQVIWRPCLGAGYIPYAYPAFGSCPCDAERCFSPAPYYCGGKTYRRYWFGKWVRAHLGHGSMLEGYPCECLYPTAGRPHLLTSNYEAEDGEGAPPALAPAQPQSLLPEEN